MVSEAENKKKSKKDYENAEKKILRYKQTNHGEPLSNEQFYLKEYGGVLAMAKFQSDLGMLVTEGLIKSIVSNEVGRLITSPDVYQQLIKEIQNKDGNLHALVRDSVQNIDNLNYLGKGLDVLAQKVAKIDENISKFEELVREQENKRKNLEKTSGTRYQSVLQQLRTDKKEAIEGFVEKELYKNEFIKKPVELLNLNDVAKYEKNYQKFVEGFLTTTQDTADKKWQWGWDDAQRMINKRIVELPSEISLAQARYFSHEVTKAILLSPSSDTTRIKNNLQKKKSLWNEYVGLKKKLEEKEDDLKHYKALLIAAENYRNEGEGFDTSLWHSFLKDHSKKQKDGRTYETTYPKQDSEYNLHKDDYKGTPPYVELLNKLATLIGQNIKDNGVKTYESFLEKMENPKFKGNPNGIFDSFRLTIVVNNAKGINYLIKNILNTAKHQKMPVFVERAKVYDSFLFSYKVNVAITREFESNSGKKKKITRVGEIKIVAKEQMAVKPLCDKIYNLRRKMKQRVGEDGDDEAREFADLSKCKTDQIKDIYDQAIKLFEDSRVKDLKFEMKFKADRSNFRNFDYHNTDGDDSKKLVQMNFEDLHDDLTKLERMLFVGALAKEDSRIKQLSFNSFMDRTEGKILNGKKPDFNVEEAKLFKTAYTNNEWEEFSSQYRPPHKKSVKAKND